MFCNFGNFGKVAYVNYTLYEFKELFQILGHLMFVDNCKISNSLWCLVTSNLIGSKLFFVMKCTFRVRKVRQKWKSKTKQKIQSNLTKNTIELSLDFSIFA